MKMFLLYVIFFISLETPIIAQGGWVAKPIGVGSGLYGKIHFFNKDVGLLCGGQEILKTTDGGFSWKVVFKVHVEIDFVDFAFVDSLNGWCLDQWHWVLKTSDGGSSWIIQNNNLPANFLSMFFTDSLNGWLVGETGRIHQSSDGGNSWFDKILGTEYISYYLFDIFFLDSLTGWIVGTKGLVLKTTDKGENWIRHDPKTNEALTKVFFIDSLCGWAIGTNGIIIHSTDGGVSWERQSFGNTKKLNDIFFVNKNKGWIVGNGMIIYTSDCGEHWVQQNTPTEIGFNSIFFSDSTTGWVLGPKDTILFTSSGGNTFINYENNENSELICKPSPFEIMTEIIFNVTHSCNAKLGIYDRFGNELAVLVDEYLVAGNYNQIFDGSGYPSGLYCLKLQLNDRTFVFKTLLIK